eukprot:8988797-Karenia_brevis.AAC.1
MITSGWTAKLLVVVRCTPAAIVRPPLAVQWCQLLVTHRGYIISGYASLPVNWSSLGAAGSAWLKP